jgi:hypothetical protein
LRDLREDDGKIVEHASFATEFKNLPLTSFSSVGSPFESGKM